MVPLKEKSGEAMKVNLHTHTWRCNHATGVEQEYVDNAIQAGLEVLGFSDHSPYIFPGSYYSTHRMRLELLEDYVQTVLSVRQEYAGKIQIPLGLELEYYPGLLPQLLPMLRDQPLDYLLLGQHFIGDEVGEPYCGRLTLDDRVLTRYVNQSIEGFQTGLFTYFAHPDLIHYCGSRKTYRREMARICREAKSCGIPLEYNLLGLAGGRNYPNKEFWNLAAEEGCQVILGRDAHSPKSMLDRSTEEAARAHLATLGIVPMERVSLRPIE